MAKWPWIGKMIVNRMIGRVKESNWIQNVSFIFFGKIISMLFFQLFDIVVARKLSIDEYSEWAFFYSVLSILFYVGWFGINASAKVYISKAEDLKSQKTYVKSALVVRLWISILIMIIIILSCNSVSTILGYPNKYPNLRFLLYLGGFIVFVNTYTDFFKSLYQASEDFKIMSVVTIIEYTGYFVFALIFLMISRDVKTVAWAYLLAECVALLFNYIYLNKTISLRNVSVNKDKCKVIFKYAMPLALISVGCVLLSEIDVVMLGLLGTKSDTSVYSISKHICDKAIHVNETIITGTVTSLAIINTKNFDEKKNQFLKINKVNILASIIVTMALFVIGLVGIPILYGDEYNASSQMIYLLIPYYIIFGISNLYARVLDYQDGAWIRSIWFFSAVILNIAMDYFFIPRLGARGAALSTVLSLVPYTIYTIYAIRKVFTKRYYNCTGGG